MKIKVLEKRWKKLSSDRQILGWNLKSQHRWKVNIRVKFAYYFRKPTAKVVENRYMSEKYLLVFVIGILTLSSFKYTQNNIGDLIQLPKEDLKVITEVNEGKLNVKILNGVPTYKVFLVDSAGKREMNSFSEKTFTVKTSLKGVVNLGIRDGSDKYYVGEVVVDWYEYVVKENFICCLDV